MFDHDVKMLTMELTASISDSASMCFWLLDCITVMEYHIHTLLNLATLATTLCIIQMI